jgi:lipopolysaccharide transport system permease protein
MESPNLAVLTKVRPPQRWNGYDLSAYWEHRELLLVLIQREITVRYRQTVAGILWVIGQPLLTTLVLSLLLTRLTGQVQAGTPYPLFVYTGLTAWAYFSHGLTRAAYCFVELSHLVTRVYFPRLLIPLAGTLAALLDFGVALLVMPLFLVYYGVVPSLAILALPLVVALMIVTVFGAGIWLATLNAEYRDISFALPFVLQLGLFVTPIFYSSELVPLPWRWLYALNPMVGVVEGLRWTLLSPAQNAPLDLYAISWVGALVILGSGLYMFQRREPNLADVI